MKYKILADCKAYGTCGSDPYHADMKEGEIVDADPTLSVLTFDLDGAEYWLPFTHVTPVWPESRGTEAGEFNRMQAMADFEPHDSTEPKSENVTRGVGVIRHNMPLNKDGSMPLAAITGGFGPHASVATSKQPNSLEEFNAMYDKPKDRIDAILEERGKPYGGVEDNFKNIATLWNGYLDCIDHHHLLPEDVARMMQLLKMARRMTMNTPTKDSFDDGHGYLKCEARLYSRYGGDTPPEG
jgi:hypothetical protein